MHLVKAENELLLFVFLLYYTHAVAGFQSLPLRSATTRVARARGSENCILMCSVFRVECDKKKLLRWISANGLLIEFAAKELQRDPEVIKAAVAQNPDAMLLLAKK